MPQRRLLPSLALLALLLAGCGPAPDGGNRAVSAPVAPQLNAPGDAGPSADGRVPAPAASAPAPAGVLALSAGIHVLGGGVRGVGVLAAYPAPGPRRVTVRRASAPPPAQAYEPHCLVRVEDPAGHAVAAQELPAGEAVLDLPAGPAGTWTVRVIGGRQHDRIAFELPASATWGVRGEMALAADPSLPATGWLWVPPEARTLLVEQFGGAAGDLVLRSEDGAELARSATRAATGRRLVAVLDPAPAGAVLAIDLARLGGRALMVDGVPGLLCPTPAAARALRGGTVEAAGFRCAGPLQARIRAWMARQRPEDLAVAVPLPAEPPADLAHPMAEAQLFGQYGQLTGIRGQLARQIIDPASPWCGTDWTPPAPGSTAPARVRWDTGVHAGLLSPFLPHALAALAGTPARLNPLHGDRALARRAALAAFHHLSTMTGDHLPREGNTFTAGDSYPITHAFFVFGAVGGGLPLVADLLDAEARGLWAEGALALSDKLADNQGYQSNQWSHNLLGHLGAFRATGERRALERFERQMRAYLAGAYGTAAKFGQHPAGYYLEEFGCDGNYDNMNLTSVVAALLEYRAIPGADPALVAALRASAERNLRFKSLFWLTDHRGEVTGPSAFNSRRPESSLAMSNPAGDHLASRELPIAAARARLARRPATGTFPASVFPYYVNDDEWALRLVREGLARASDAAGYAGNGHAALFHEEYRRPLPAPETLPVQAESGLWELPGVVAWKRGGTYGVVFHDVAGAEPGRKLNHAVMGGGPTALWRPGCGMAVSSDANPRKPVMLATTADEATFSCVYGTGADGRFFHSGIERTRLRWIEPGRAFAITAALRAPAGELTWRYDLGDDGAVRMAVSLTATGATAAWVNIPFEAGKEVEIALVDGAGVRRAGGAGVRLAAEGRAVELTGPLPCAGNRTVRCVRVPLAGDGTPAVITFAPER